MNLFRREENAAGERIFRLEPKIKDTVFVHIPKTAGTSMRNMLVSAQPDAVKIFDYGEQTADLDGDFINAFTGDLRTPGAIVTLRSTLAQDQQLLVSSHNPLSDYRGAFHPASFITFLRNPVDRVVSSYRHYVRHLNFRGSFAEFYESREHINVHCRMLWGTDLRDLGFVGLVEFMPDMLPALSRHLGVELRMRHDNIAGRSSQVTVDEATRSRILALNDDDLCLYRHVEANLDYFTNYRERPDPRPVLGKGKVYRTRDGAFKGWALAFDPGRLAEIEVRIGEQVVHRCYADQFLPWMKKGTPHGVGGFLVRMPAELLETRKPIRFVIVGTGKDLDGSPFLCAPMT